MTYQLISEALIYGCCLGGGSHLRRWCEVISCVAQDVVVSFV